MSKETLIQKIESEIERLNMRIDLKVIKGLSYLKESRRHKFLFSQLANLTREKVKSVKFTKPMKTVRRARSTKSTWFQKIGNFVGAFIF